MPTLLLRTDHGTKILQFDSGSSFLLKIHKNFCYQYVKFRNAVYKKVHLDLLQRFLKIKLIVNSLKNLWINSVVPLSVLSIT